MYYDTTTLSTKFKGSLVLWLCDTTVTLWHCHRIMLCWRQWLEECDIMLELELDLPCWSLRISVSNGAQISHSTGNKAPLTEYTEVSRHLLVETFKLSHTPHTPWILKWWNFLHIPLYWLTKIGSNCFSTDCLHFSSVSQVQYGKSRAIFSLLCSLLKIS